MKKMSIILGIALVMITIPAYAVTQVYDSERGVFYIGGYVLDNAIEVINKKITTKYRKKIFVIDVSKDESRVFLEPKNNVVFFELSNKGYMAVSHSNYVPNAPNPYQDYLAIYNTKGEQIKVIEHVPVNTEKKYFAWSPDGTKIVFVKGERIPDYWAPFKPMGVWLYDIEKDKLKKISEDGWDVRWARYDNNIHILKHKAGPTYIYDTTTGKLTENKEGKGIIFSPDGKYYVGITLEPGDRAEKERYHVFDGNLDKKIFTFEPDYTYWGESKFVSNKYLLIWGHDWYFKTYDVMSKSNYSIPQKKVLLGWNKDMTKVVVYDGGNKIHIDELLTGKRLKSIEIPK